MSGGLTLERGVHGENHFLDASRTDALDQAVDRQILRSNAFQGRETAAKHMISARKQPRAVKCPQVGDFLHDAEALLVPARIAADAAGVRSVNVSADGASRELFRNALEG